VLHSQRVRDLVIPVLYYADRGGDITTRGPHPLDAPKLMGQQLLDVILRHHLEKFSCTVEAGTELRSLEQSNEALAFPEEVTFDEVLWSSDFRCVYISSTPIDMRLTSVFFRANICMVNKFSEGRVFVAGSVYLYFW